jgi:hypothetical protein
MFSKLFGAQELEYVSASSSQSTGTNTSRTTGRGQQGGGLLAGTTVSPHYQSSHASTASSSATTGTTHRFQVRSTFLPGEIRGLPMHHALIEIRDNHGRVTPATLIHLDRVLVGAVQEAQQLRLYRQGSVSASARRSSPNVASPQEYRRVAHLQAATARPAGPDEQTTATEHRPPPPADPWTVLAQRLEAELHLEEAAGSALIAWAREHGHSADYLAEMLTYVLTEPNIQAPAAVFRRLIEANTLVPRSTPAGVVTQKEGA